MTSALAMRHLLNNRLKQKQENEHTLMFYFHKNTDISIGTQKRTNRIREKLRTFWKMVHTIVTSQQTMDINILFVKSLIFGYESPVIINIYISLLRCDSLAKTVTKAL